MGFSNLLPLASNRSVMVDPTKANNISHIWENMSKEMAYGKKKLRFNLKVWAF
jgi:hypothetical protein